MATLSADDAAAQVQDVERAVMADATQVYLDEDAIGVYLLALDHPVLQPADLVSTGLTEEAARAALARLEAHELITRISTHRWRVVSPEVALASVAARLEERARGLRRTAPGLMRRYQEGQSRDLTTRTGNAPLTTLEAVDDAVQHVIATADRHVQLMHSDSAFLRMLMDTPIERHGRALTNTGGQVLRTRVVFDAGLLGDDRLHRRLERRAVVGDIQRITRGVPFSAYVNDTGLAVVDLSTSSRTPLGLVLDDRLGSAAVVRAIDWAFGLGVPWEPVGGAPAPARAHAVRAGFDDRDTEILRLLAIGASDSTVARQLGVSQRTVERRVRTILDRLNAVNRFQAGVLAAQRNLL